MVVAKKTGKTKRETSKLYYGVAGSIAVLLVLHWIAVYGDTYARGSVSSAFIGWFDLDMEKNVPTVISSLFFVLAAYWCIRLSRTKEQTFQRVGWWLFALFFVYLGLDEYLIIHEQAAEPLRKILNILPGNPFFHAGVVRILNFFTTVVPPCLLFHNTKKLMLRQ